VHQVTVEVQAVQRTAGVHGHAIASTRLAGRPRRIGAGLSRPARTSARGVSAERGGPSDIDDQDESAILPRVKEPQDVESLSRDLVA